MREMFVGARQRARLGLACACALLVAVATVTTQSAHATTAASYTVTEMKWTVKVGPAPQESCTIVGEMYKPNGASASNPVPAILTTNGFGGSYKDQDDLAATFANQGYAVLTYSGLGFGGSGCKIELDSPTWDGEAASQLVSFLGGSFASDEGDKVNYVIHDATDHAGHHDSDDPRVGMIGGSYGGEIQFAAADVDPRVDAIIPFITWNNLSYSLAPNNTPDTDVLDEISGVAKFEWVDLFSGDGIADGLQGASADPTRDVGCPNFDTRACSAMAALNTTGNADASTVGFAQQASVYSYMKNIKIPTMLMQGEDDTLFNLHEAVATYDELRAQNTPVKMVWQSWGHSNGTPAPGEWASGALNSDGSWTTEGKLVEQWFAHYLKGAAAAPALNFSYFQPWVQANQANADQDYASLSQYPSPNTQQLFLSGTGDLTSAAGSVASGSSTFAVPPAGAPTSTSEISAVSQTVPLSDTPGTFAAFESAPLTQTENVVGIPTVNLQVSDTLGDSISSLDPSGGLSLIFKLEDIAPDGTVTLPDRLVSPARFTDLENTVSVSLPGIVHQFAAGDRIKLIVAAGDSAYRGNTVPSTVTLTTSPSAPGTLSIPIVKTGQATPLVFASVPASKTPAAARPKIQTRGKAVVSGRKLSVKLVCAGTGTCAGRVILRSGTTTLLNGAYPALKAGGSETATFTLSTSAARRLAKGVTGTLTVSSQGRTLVQHKEYKAVKARRK